MSVHAKDELVLPLQKAPTHRTELLPVHTLSELQPGILKDPPSHTHTHSPKDPKTPSDSRGLKNSRASHAVLRAFCAFLRLRHRLLHIHEAYKSYLHSVRENLLNFSHFPLPAPQTLSPQATRPSLNRPSSENTPPRNDRPTPPPAGEGGPKALGDYNYMYLITFPSLMLFHLDLIMKVT